MHSSCCAPCAEREKTDFGLVLPCLSRFGVTWRERTTTADSKPHTATLCTDHQDEMVETNLPTSHSIFFRINGWDAAICDESRLVVCSVRKVDRRGVKDVLTHTHMTAISKGERFAILWSPGCCVTCRKTSRTCALRRGGVKEMTTSCCMCELTETAHLQWSTG